jgi:DNA helicase HerA-like ATPase
LSAPGTATNFAALGERDRRAAGAAARENMHLLESRSMAIDTAVLDAARAAFPSGSKSITLGAVVHDGQCGGGALVGIPLPMINRHGLIAGATGTGKTKTLQLIAEQLSANGVPVFLADIKGDVSGIATAGASNDRVTQRAKDTGYDWKPTGYPAEFLSLTGTKGAQLRATVSSFGPLLLAKVLGLNDTQSSVLSLVFKYCDDKGLLLLDLSDLRAVLQYLSEEGAADLRDYGGMSKQTVGVLLREMVELEQQGADRFFGEPQFELTDLLKVGSDGRGVVSVLELQDVQDKPALFSTFMLWMLATLYHDLPEVGDVDEPKLVFFFDEAHLIFDDASKALLDQIEQVVRLIRSKGVGVFFITQSPKDVPATVLGQLGHRVQHALRAFTPDDEKAMKAAARTFPKTKFYDIEETLTSLGIGEALVTVLAPNGVPTQPFATRLIPPASRMGPLTDDELQQRLASSAQVRRYATAVDRESAREMLSARAGAAASAADDAPEQQAAAPQPRGGKAPPSTFEQILKSPVTRTVAGVVTRGLMGALMGSLGISAARRRRR